MKPKALYASNDAGKVPEIIPGNHAHRGGLQWLA